MRRCPWVAVLLLSGSLASGCVGESEDRPADRGERRPPEARPLPSEPPRVARWRAGPGEDQADAKETAAGLAQASLTYPRGSTPLEVGARVVPGRGEELGEILSPAVRPGWRSWARVVYPQLSGLGVDTVGTMVMVDQTVESPNGRKTTYQRVLDVRLRRSGQAFVLDELGSIGGMPIAPPAGLSEVERRVLDNPRLRLSDSARWDIYGGKVDQGLLAVLLSSAEKHRLTVGPMISGHPLNVWETARVSAHSQGLAADIWAVDGEPVARQRGAGSRANQLAADLVGGGAAQVGSPLPVAGAGSSFSDGVHQDHIHLQQSSVAVP